LKTKRRHHYYEHDLTTWKASRKITGEVGYYIHCCVCTSPTYSIWKDKYYVSLEVSSNMKWRFAEHERGADKFSISYQSRFT